MEDTRIKIKLIVAQRVVELTIEREWEIYYRKAEKIINDSFFDFAKKWSFTDHQDILTKILINFVVEGIATEERLNAYEENLIPKMKDLKLLADQITVD
ncbi:MAG TPA: hypothetical protein PLH70_01835 [Bacteroidales bacterium]|nr:hypothetical protein [Bacteroidales bacterium]HOH22151.1 hypothetical protein [Bacteroidales bacterium]HPB57720.1 hypothetical protein [Bacteroidales bacterium]HPZ04294.1 hypothetical protein [Bacteroidales bacterium]HQB74525.1 hypothetical protein [Bacteroidales bacterium]